MIEILTTITELVGAGFICAVTPEIIICVNEATMEWAVFKALAGEIVTASGRTL